MTVASGSPLFELHRPPLSQGAKLLFRSSYVFFSVLFVLCLLTRQYVVALGPLLVAFVPSTLRKESTVRVIAYRDALTVRNRDGEQTIPRADIVEFYVATPSLVTALKQHGAVGPTIYVRHPDGSSTPLHATFRKFPDASVPESLNQLQEWLHRLT